MLLKRQFVTLSPEETVVVINTLDQNYQRQAINYCKELGVEYHITKSNGTPGKGKNAVQDIFLASEDEYCVQIDGDDIVTPFGIDYYKSIAATNPPDGIVNLNTTSVKLLNENAVYSQWPDAPRYEMNLQEAYKKYPMKRNEIRRAIERKDVWYDSIMRIKEHQNQWNYPSDSIVITHCPRFLFWSRKICEHFRFNEDLMVGEDTLVVWHLRDVAYRGLIKLEKVIDTHLHTYVYDHRRSGIMRPLSVALDWEWAVQLVIEMDFLSQNWTVPPNFELKHCEVDISNEKQKLFDNIIKEYFL
jgi:hypothetical protein